MPLTVENYIDSIRDRRYPKCSYIFTKGKHKDLVCGNRVYNDMRNLPVKNWRCNTCKDKIGDPTKTYFDNMLLFGLQNGSVPQQQVQIPTIRFNIFDLLSNNDFIDMLDNISNEINQIETQRESLQRTQPLLQSVGQLPNQTFINNNNVEIPPPKIFEEDENCDKPCVICLTKAPRFAIIPCGHLIFCDDCGTKDNINKIKNECSVCKIHITSLMRIYT
jgi:hypothetical protein